MTTPSTERPQLPFKRVVCGIWCYNEEGAIGTMLRNLVQQTIFADDSLEKIVMIVPNGCKDDTAGEARRVADELLASDDAPKATEFRVQEIEEGGKANAWNISVRTIPEGVDVLFGFDADTDLQQADGLEQLLHVLANDDVQAASSTPIKDLAFEQNLSFVEKMILANGRVLDGGSSSIAGSMYALKEAVFRDVHMPKGLVVEDGFLAGMTKTKGFREEAREENLRQLSTVNHVYESERTIASVFKHQKRLVLGGAINSHLFRFIETLPPEENRAERLAALDKEQPNWLPELIGKRHQEGHPLVPTHFLMKRWSRLQTGSLVDRLKLLPKVALGFVVDAYGYLGARKAMSRPDRGLGTW
ncbi:MAG: hypothetical protein AAF830_08025 [Pseudomonadota bacterium]